MPRLAPFKVTLAEQKRLLKNDGIYFTLTHRKGLPIVRRVVNATGARLSPSLIKQILEKGVVGGFERKQVNSGADLHYEIWVPPRNRIIRKFFRK